MRLRHPDGDAISQSLRARYSSEMSKASVDGGLRLPLICCFFVSEFTVYLSAEVAETREVISW